MWGSAVLSAVVAAVGAPAAPLAVHQEPLIRHLLVAGERVEIGYAVDTPPGSAWVLEKPFVVRLGVHRFGRTRAPEAVVARAGPSQVGVRTQGDVAGPQTFVVGRDRSIWLFDGLKQRLLVWRAGRPGV